MAIIHVLLIVFCVNLFGAPTLSIRPQIPRPPHPLPSQQAVIPVPPAPALVETSTTLMSYAADLPVATMAKPEHKAVVRTEDQPAQHQLYIGVAARSLGEGSFALPEIACTIKNRLRVSRGSLPVVLRAYHARDVKPNAEQIETVRQVFEGELPCPVTWWYALSLQDTAHWRPHNRGPAKIIKQNARKQILIFDR